MQRYLTVRYTSLLLIFLIIYSYLHYLFVSPFLQCMISNDAFRQSIETLTIFIIGPVLCILLVVIMINIEESKLYDSLL
ncbi:MAG: hypothetical protein RR512_00355 [Coprobacillus sp.]